MAVGAVLAALAVLAGVALLGLSGWFITATALAGLVPAGALMFDVFMPGAGIRLLAILRTAARYGERVVAHDATLALLAALRERLFRGFAQPGIARALAARPARLLFRLSVDVDALDSVYLRLLVPGAAAVATALCAGVALALIDWRLGVGLPAALLLPGLGLPLWLAGAAERAARRRAAALEALRVRGVDLVAGQTAWLMAGRLPAQTEAVMAAEARLAEADDALHRLETLAGLVFGLAGALLLGGMGWAVAALGLPAPQAALALLVALAAMEPFAALRRGAIEMGRGARAAARLLPAMEAVPPAPAMLPPQGVALRLSALRYTPPGAARPLFDGLSLDIATGEYLVVTGPSGAGKSTLLALLTGEATPQSGGIALLPHALLSQRVELFQDSLRGNLLLAAPGADDAALAAALQEAGLEGLSLDSRLGEGGAGLSAGQRRRLALARVLLRDAPLWLLDEATEALDGDTARQVLARLGRRDGQAVLAVAHLRREAEMADRIIRLEQGRITGEWRRGKAGFAEALARLRPG
ncbi:ATP-binding cassette domain-containing protein [Rhodovarius crocodyli]|uniref:ATP-binding cassette domain-containing protein n=2 Tax=Rhodovarius crocodyli TaxID=1979269 RepID=A0A437MPR2_9PROT|nr:ATP-binding cassette domain-containing protein [Rhodovarius crocodyli]